jgi:hypothetical protein
MTDRPDNIVRLDTTKRPIEIKRGYDGCQHTHLEIHSKYRTVQCRKCKAYLDPIQALIDLTNENHPHWVSVKMIQARIDQKEKELEEVRRLLRNAKASLRRVQKRDDV